MEHLMRERNTSYINNVKRRIILEERKECPSIVRGSFGMENNSEVSSWFLVM